MSQFLKRLTQFLKKFYLLYSKYVEFVPQTAGQLGDILFSYHRDIIFYVRKEEIILLLDCLYAVKKTRYLLNMRWKVVIFHWAYRNMTCRNFILKK